MYHLRVPQTEEELERYYQFRWEMLRKPLHQPKGSERDAWDAMAHHQMVVDEQGNLVAVGRLYINADNEASIRFMAVHPDVQDKGLGTLMAMTLESTSRTPLPTLRGQSSTVTLCCLADWRKPGTIRLSILKRRSAAPFRHWYLRTVVSGGAASAN